ncbi:MAG: hypothetical protein Q9214_002282 [Letrouitia sp. 1 TL-2023]
MSWQTFSPPLLLPMNPPKIAIIGAGPAGCTLARLLILSSIPVTVFEGETSFSARTQGGTLDLHTHTGQAALKECGLFSDFLEHARYDGEAISVIDKNLTAYIKLGGARGEKSSRGRPEIDRSKLREILVGSLPKSTIRWGCRLRKVDPQDLSLHFDHGMETGFDLVVGADGVWSKVRPLLSAVKPIYSGVGGFDLVIKDAEARHAEISRFVNRGSVFAYSDNKCVVLQQRGDDSLIVHAWSARDEQWTKACGFDVHNPREVKAALRKDFADWKEPLLSATQVADDEELVTLSLYLLPSGHSWEGRPGVTLIGDAAHLMTPFGGEGVNIAMTDAMKLAHAIIDASNSDSPSTSLKQNVRDFELDMFKRAAPVAEMSRLQMMDMMFTPGAPRSIIDSWVRRALGDNWLIRLFLPLWLNAWGEDNVKRECFETIVGKVTFVGRGNELTRTEEQGLQRSTRPLRRADQENTQPLHPLIRVSGLLDQDHQVPTG